MTAPVSADSPVLDPEPVVEPVAEAPAEPTPEPVVEPAAEVVTAELPVVPTLEDRVPVGSVFTRTHFGWSVRVMYGGALRLSGDGATMDHALTDAGLA